MIQLFKIFIFSLFFLAWIISCITASYHYEVLSPTQTELVYHLPDNQPITGVLFLAHGCSHGATDWCTRGTSHRELQTDNNNSHAMCRGLPVELSIVRKALAKGLLVVVTSSSNREHKCWTQKDIAPTLQAIKYVYSKVLLTEGTQKVPLYLMG